jgi:Holliday junction resolvase RusA-like endonuclease
MTRPLTIVLMGAPVAFARTRISRTGGLFTPMPQRNAAATLRVIAQTEMQAAGIATYHEPISLILRAELPIPASWSKKKRAAAILGIVRPGRPDLDNIVKLCSDALNHVAYADDALIAELRAEKRYGLAPKITLSIVPILRPVAELPLAEAAE